MWRAWHVTLCLSGVEDATSDDDASGLTWAGVALRQDEYSRKVLEVVVPDAAVSGDVRDMLVQYVGSHSLDGPLPIRLTLVIGG